MADDARTITSEMASRMLLEVAKRNSQNTAEKITEFYDKTVADELIVLALRLKSVSKYYASIADSTISDAVRVKVQRRVKVVDELAAAANTALEGLIDIVTREGKGEI